MKINLDSETFLALLESAVDELRPVDLHAAVVLRRALGLPFPFPSSGGPRETTPDAGEPRVAHPVAPLRGR
jgi:hypothetical protein